MLKRAVFALAVALLSAVAPSIAVAQTSSTRATLEAQNNAVITPNGVGSITGAKLNGMLGNMIASTFTLLDPIPLGVWGCAAGPNCVPSSLTTLPASLNIPTPTLTGQTTFGNLYSISAPAHSGLFTGATVLSNTYVSVTATSSTSAEIAAVFRLNTTIGAPNYNTAFKQSLGYETIAGAGSASSWGMAGVLTTTAGFPTGSAVQISTELDQNQLSGIDCVDIDYGVSGQGCMTLLVTAGAGNKISTAIGVEGSNAYLNGLTFYSASAVSNSIKDYSQSQVAYNDVGSHLIGAYYQGTYSSFAIAVGSSGNFSVTGAGATLAASLRITGLSVAGAVCNSASGVLSTTTGKCSGSDPSDVTSVFTRTGAVVAQTGDYTVSQITGAAPSANPTFTGSVTATGLITNADLVNSSVTVNTVSCTLGSSCTISAAASLVIGSTTITGGVSTQCLYNNAGVLGNQACGGAGSLTVGTTTISSGTSGDIEFNNAGVLGEKGVTGSGANVVLATAPSISSLTVTTAFTATGLVTLADITTIATNTVLVNATSGTASPTAQNVATCSTAASALIWTTNTGFGCNTSITANAVPAANLTGATLAAGVTASSLTSVGTLASLAVTGAVTNGGETITSASATAFSVGLNGATNPSFVVNDSTALQVAGLSITGAVTGGTVAVATLDSGAASNLTINAKGTGTIGIGTVSTGAITLTRATTMSAALTYGGVTLSNAVTGTGNMVLATSPSLTTPALGIATAISLDIGGATLGANAFAVSGTSLFHVGTNVDLLITISGSAVDMSFQNDTPTSNIPVILASTLITLTSPAVDFNGVLVSTGTPPVGTTGSCVASSFSGGATAGKFSAAVCVAGTIILSAMPTAATGYSCVAVDQTTPADTLQQTASTTTSVTFKATAAAADSVTYSCIGW